MCIIGIKPHTADDFTEEILKYCWDKNDDGAGYAWYNDKNKTWMVRKGFMKFDDFLTSYKAMKFGKGTTSIVHFRIGTSGFKDAGNTHPFPVCDDLEQMRVTEFEADAIAFHNGTVGKGDTKYSDTEHHIANVLFPIFPLWEDERVHGEIAETLLTKNSSRWVVCVKDKYYPFGTWHKHNGWEFSNMNYEPVSYVYSSYNSGKTKHYNAYDEDKWWDKEREESRKSDVYKEAQTYGLPTGFVWAHGKLNGELGFWAGGKFTTWKNYIEEMKKKKGVVEFPSVKNYSYKIDNQGDFDDMFTDLLTNKEGKSFICMNWKKFAIHLFCVKKTGKTKKDSEPEKEDHLFDNKTNFVTAIVSAEGEFLFESKEIEREMKDNIEDYRMCPACFEAAFLIPSPYVNHGTHMCNNCGCVFTLETGEVFMYDPEIQQKYMKRRN